MWGSFAEMQGSLCENVNVESSKAGLDTHKKRSLHSQKKRPTDLQKSHKAGLYSHKRRSLYFRRKRFTFPQKSPVDPQKSPIAGLDSHKKDPCISAKRAL